MTLKIILEKRTQAQVVKDNLREINSLISLAEKLDKSSRKVLPCDVNIIDQAGLRTLQVSAETYEHKIAFIAQEIEDIYKENGICPKCDGKGSYESTDCGYQWSETKQYLCPRCHGTGKY